MEKLFDDSETFQKERPKEITEKQENELYSKLAKEIISNGWCIDELEEDIIYDLKHLSRNDTGFEMAKDLEDYNMKCNYEIDTDFIYWFQHLHIHSIFAGYIACAAHLAIVYHLKKFGRVIQFLLKQSDSDTQPTAPGVGMEIVAADTGTYIGVI